MIIQISGANKGIQKFDVVLADPPYSYDRPDRNLPKYPLLTNEQIFSLHLEEFFADDCILFLWCTVPCLPKGMEILTHWGFEYKTTIIWKKSFYRNPSGYWFKTVCEFLLLGKKGNIYPFHSPLENVFFIEPTIHSEKPFEFYSIIEKLTPNMKRIELFARKEHSNWFSWGNEL